ncbi:alanyl-tRNA editing protein [Chitinimonas lacunae]|uniref:Alanine--tRNA ligase n=1 Tax=Chitinimonas lacunae TaxID=1963018 RepID=A0ABV8MVH3_9NEIS
MTAWLFRDDAYQTSTDAIVLDIDQHTVRLDRTVFYPNGGGQPGDSGWLEHPDGRRLRIRDTVKGEQPDEIVHLLDPDADLSGFAPGTSLRAVLDWERRHRHMRYHTCLHLLCAVIPAPVTGGQVASDKARLDFAIEMAALDAAAIEARLNALIAAASPVESRWIDDAELDANPQLVRTMSVQPPRGQGRVRLIAIDGIDLQPCGGTHVRNTAEIGPVVVQKIKSEGKRNKRVVIAFAGE